MASPEYLEAENAKRALWIIRTAIVRLTELDIITAAQMAWAGWQELYGPDEEGRRKSAAERLRLLRAVGARLRRLTRIGLTEQERSSLQQLATLTFDDRQAVFGFGLGPPGQVAETTAAPREASARGRETAQQITLGV